MLPFGDVTGNYFNGNGGVLDTGYIYFFREGDLQESEFFIC